MGRIEQFLSNYPNVRTRSNYRQAITRFLDLSMGKEGDHRYGGGQGKRV